MSDVMLYGILRMPYELAMNDEVSRFQFYKNAQRAADRIEELEKIIREGIQAFGAVQEQQLKDKFENTIWCDCGDAITKDSGAKCGVCVGETK